ncbi:unnamed protein product [Notodromas monacha]|uniref:BTB domain-containing protein n=1 Tax=Notodromas monacha TaxID=399045 RepID=A0A7R9G935_9CRUS|nr:unnamed protein product [Notodromas monacha]CAG0912424.1 unnamed protein product [Notodromas monacha]
MSHSSRVTFGPSGKLNLENILNVEPLSDVTIICSEGAEKVHAHSSVLSQASIFLKDLLTNSTCCCQSKVVFLPQWHSRHLIHLLQLVYLGEVELYSAKELEELCKLGRLLGIEINRWNLEEYSVPEVTIESPPQTLPDTDQEGFLDLFDNPPPFADIDLPPKSFVKNEPRDEYDDDCVIVGVTPSSKPAINPSNNSLLRTVKRELDEKPLRVVSLPRNSGHSVTSDYASISNCSPKSLESGYSKSITGSGSVSNTPSHNIPSEDDEDFEDFLSSRRQYQAEIRKLNGGMKRGFPCFERSSPGNSDSQLGFDPTDESVPPVLRYFEDEERKAAVLKAISENRHPGLAGKLPKMNTHDIVDSGVEFATCEMCRIRGKGIPTTHVCRECVVPLHDCCSRSYHDHVGIPTTGT